MSAPARADKGEIVIAGWGGSRTTAMREVMFKPFEAATGIRVKDDGPPEAAKVKAQVDSGNITWDILDTDIPAILTMAKNNLLDRIDYAKLDAGRLAADSQGSASRVRSRPPDLRLQYRLQHKDVSHREAPTILGRRLER